VAAKYERVADDLRVKILAGIEGFEPGARLPSETQLANAYDISVPTMREAIRVLRLEGLIIAKQGVGSFVRSERQRIRRSADRYQWEKDRVREPESERKTTGATEKDTGFTLEDLKFYAAFDQVPADAQIAKDFGVGEGTPMLRRLYRTQSRNEDAPVSLVTSFLVYDLASQNPDQLDESKEPWPGGTQHQLSTIGVEVAEIEDVITTRPPTQQEADQLGINPVGVAVFLLRKTSIDITGRVVEVSYVVLPGDRTEFVYRTKLKRWEWE
jgi:GntR family transcriptional regulator